MGDKTVPQTPFFDNQDVLDINIDDLYHKFIVPIDAIRSHFNALVPGSTQLNTVEYQESRCHAFYRMIGFPIVASDGTYYSPGFDPNVNLDQDRMKTNQGIANKIIADRNFISNQLNPREQIYKTYSQTFASGGMLAQALTLGSMFIRSFENQFGDTDPLETDKTQVQTINDRLDEIGQFFGVGVFSLGNNTGASLFTSNHLLKPFVVDPRINTKIIPLNNMICAPFLKNKSQTKIFTSQQGSDQSLSRPFIERVISTRFNNANVTTKPGDEFIQGILEDIKANSNITDKELLDIVNNPLNQINQSELTIFDNYFKIIKALIKELVESIQEIEYIRKNINFQPLPDPNNGIESGTNGANIPPPVPNDPNNLQVEKDIIFLTQKKYLNDIEFSVGLQGVADPGDFVFSNLDDMVFSVDKSVQKSFDDQLETLQNYRNKLENSGINDLKTIEIIMGEFSGIGLIDIVAIQATFWIMNPNDLLGLIDLAAFQRISLQPNINIAALSQTDVISALKNYEQQLKNVYKLIQSYYDSLIDGSSFNQT